MFEIIFIRHGETEWNLNRIVMGDKPIPLNDNGKRQALRLRDHLNGVEIDGIYSSPIVRAIETAEVVRGDRPLPIVETRELTEINYGEWVGRSFSDIFETDEFGRYYWEPSGARVPGGESLVEVSDRIVGFVERMRGKGLRRVIAVSHADVIKAVLAHYFGGGLDLLHRIRIDNGSCSIVGFHGNSERVLMVNALPSLDDFLKRESFFLGPPACAC